MRPRVEWAMCSVRVRKHEGVSANERRRNGVDRNFEKTKEEQEEVTVVEARREVQETAEAAPKAEV